MTNYLFPTEYYKSTYSINFDKYYNLGYRAIIFDIDNTLVPHDAKHDDRSRKLFKHLNELGFKICFVSNNDKDRVEPFCNEVGGNYICKAGKPMAKGYIKAMKKMGTTRENTLFVLQTYGELITLSYIQFLLNQLIKKRKYKLY